MELWLRFWNCANTLRPAFSRNSTFSWFVVALAGMLVRVEHAGVTSIVRALNLKPLHYRSLLNLFSTTGWSVKEATRLWVGWVMRVFGQFTVNGRYILVADGIKAPREGKKMPAVKSLHQESESNSKSPYIMGHSFQAVGLLFRLGKAVFAIPLACRIHEGLVLSNRDKRTLHHKLAGLLSEITAGMPKLIRKYLVADAYYSCRAILEALFESGDDLIARVKSNVVGYTVFEQTAVRGRGRPKKYGKKVKLKDLFADRFKFHRGTVAGYGNEMVEVEYHSVNLLWKPIGRTVKFVLVVYPNKGKAIFISTDLNLGPLTIIELYAMRFKIEVSFKQAVHTIGTFAYRFWLKSMKRIKRCSGNQHLHREPIYYRESVFAKLESYHRFVFIGLVAQGFMQYLSTYFAGNVYALSPWLRTMTASGHPSEETVAAALRTALPEFYASTLPTHALMKILTKFRRADQNFAHRKAA